MRVKRGSQYYGSNISFIDMLFNIIIVFVLLFFVSVLLMNLPTQKKNNIESKAEYMIVLTWPDNSPHDIDLWMKTPDDKFIGYPRKENSYAYLERDDLGAVNNYIERDNMRIALPVRREVIVIRGKVPGRYVVNVHFFAARGETGEVAQWTGSEIPVSVELININPSYKILARKEIKLNNVREEKTAFSFIIRDDNISDIDSDLEELFITELMTVRGP